MRELHNRNLRKPQQRLANWIRGQATTGLDDQRIDLPYPKKVLASILGMSLATLSRDIEALEAHGISFEGRTILVRSSQALAELANPCPVIDD